MDRQPRLTDLVPQRYTSFALVFCSGLAMIAILEAAHFWMPHLSAYAGGERLAMFDLADSSSLGVWLSSTLLAGAALGALVVYYVRRHKADDYHGRYRVWLWAAACWLLMSVDTSSSLHEAFSQVMAHFSGTHVYGDGSIWWVAAWFLVLGPISIRLTIDMRSCKLSTTAMIAALVCWTVAVLTRLQVLVDMHPTFCVMVHHGAELFGHLLLAVAMWLHARYVIRDSQGLITAKATKPAAKKAETKPAASTTPKRSDLAAPPKPSTAPSTASAAAARARLEAEDDEDEDDYEDRTARRDRVRHRVDDEHDEGDRKLSKADRKAMRRAKEQQRRYET